MQSTAQPPACFEAEHLANIEISSEGERKILHPEEAIIRLHELAFSKCLKPVKVVLRLEPSELTLVDQKEGYTIERLPYSSVIPCREVFVKSVNDRFPNLALFTVGDSFDIVPAEFYIFQFANTSAVAKDFIQKLIEIKECHDKQSHNDKCHATSDATKSDATQMMEDQAQRTAFATWRYKEPPNYKLIPSLFSGTSSPNAHSPNVESQILDRYLELLNKSLDDVEKFVMRLQQAAAAYQELEEKRKFHKKLSDHEEGLLIVQARPPPPKDYFDIFQKIKFTFNLLAKLKGLIKNPTAAEMIHHIFHPLDLIVEASCAILGPDDQPLWEHVINPLLTHEAVVFLEDCLVTKEMELWRSLGSAWNISASEREFWLNCVHEVPMYLPVFYDGWSPPSSLLGEICPKLDRRGSQAPQTFAKPGRQSRYLLEPHAPHQGPPDTSPFRPADLQHHQGLVTKRSNSPCLPRTTVGSSPRWSPTYPTQVSPQYPLPPLSQTCQVVENHDPQREFLASLLAKGSKVYIATADKTAENNMELSVTAGQVLEVLESNRFNSKVRNSDGIIGYVNNSVVSPFAMMGSAETDLRNRKSSSDGDKNQKSALDNLNEEFQLMLKTEADPTRKKAARGGSSVSGIITAESSPEEVTAWLAQKGFGEPIQSSLSSFGGKQLFVMDKTILEKLFGFDTGSRLYSQILVQKNRSGYKTMRAKELQSILAQRKKKSDSIMEGLGFNVQDATNLRNSQIFAAAFEPPPKGGSGSAAPQISEQF